MRYTESSTKFRRDLKRELKGLHRYLFVKGGEFDTVKNILQNDIPLPAKYRDHALHNNWEGFRECHIRPDLLLIYRYEGEDFLILERIGTHSEIFGL